MEKLAQGAVGISWRTGVQGVVGNTGSKEIRETEHKVYRELTGDKGTHEPRSNRRNWITEG
jgi:hypothetical protein